MKHNPTFCLVSSKTGPLKLNIMKMSVIKIARKKKLHIILKSQDSKFLEQTLQQLSSCHVRVKSIDTVTCSSFKMDNEENSLVCFSRNDIQNLLSIFLLLPCFQLFRIIEFYKKCIATGKHYEKNLNLVKITEMESSSLPSTSARVLQHDDEAVDSKVESKLLRSVRKGTRKHYFTEDNSDAEEEPFECSGSEYSPAFSTDSENFAEDSKLKTKKFKPSFCRNLFERVDEFSCEREKSVTGESVKSVRILSRNSILEVDLVENEDLLEFADGCVIYKTKDGLHRSELFLSNINETTFQLKLLCDFKNCDTKDELVLTKTIVNKNEYVIRFATCVKGGCYKGSEYKIGDNTFVAVLRKNRKDVKDFENKTKHNCLFCSKQVCDLTHHLKLKHCDEPRVKEALDFPNYSKERIRSLRMIRNEGNRNFENKNESEPSIPSRKATKYKCADYLECKNCHGKFVYYNYSRHVRKCSALPANYRQRVKEVRIEQLTSDKLYSLNEELIEELLKPLRHDDERLTIENDVALRAYASYYSISSRTTAHGSKNVRAQLRLLARLLNRIQVIDPTVLSYSELLNLRRYDLLLLGVMSLVGFKLTTNAFTKSYTPLILKSCLLNLARALKFFYHKTKSNLEDITDLDLFLENFGTKYAQDISKAAYRMNANLKVIQKTPIPSNDDIAAFARYVETKADEAYAALSAENFSYKNYLKLGRSVLIMLLVLNRRRIGETSRITLQCYQQRETVTSEIRKSLNIMEQQLANHLSVVKLVGKRLRQLTILISEKHVKYLDKLVSLREMAGVDANNAYLFAAPNSLKFIDASSTLREFAFKCGAKEPQKLRATLFRKQVATMAQMMQLNDNEIQQLADFMGHTVEVHKEHYRKNCNYQQIVVLSRLFMALEAGDIERFKNKPLSEVEIMLQDDQNMPWLEDELNFPQEQADVDVVDSHALDIIQEIEDNNISSLAKEGNLEIVPSTSGECSTRTPRKETASCLVTRKVKGTPEKSPIKKKKPFTPEELKVLKDNLGKFIAQGKYPDQPKRLYQKLLIEYKHIFNKKRTVQTLHSYVQNEIRKVKKK